MNWYDWITLVIMALVTVIQTVRGVRAGGMGLPLFEAAGVVLAAVAATAFAHTLAGPIQARDTTMMLVLFIVFSVVAFFVARWLFALTALSLQSLDGIFSVLCGLVMAWAVAHMFLRIMIGSEGGETSAAIANSPIAREVFQFRTWNELMRLLFKTQAGPDFDPTEG
jgi:hypothetical protein